MQNPDTHPGLLFIIPCVYTLRLRSILYCASDFRFCGYRAWRWECGQVYLHLLSLRRKVRGRIVGKQDRWEIRPAESGCTVRLLLPLYNS